MAERRLEAWYGRARRFGAPLAAVLAVGLVALAIRTGADEAFADSSVRVGAQARVTAGVNVRSCPNTSCGVVGGLSPGDIVTIDAGPQSGAGYRWWHHNRGGWSIDNNLTYYSAPQPPQPPQPPVGGGGPNGFTRCANENQRCSFSGTAEVQYGANGHFTSSRTFTNGVDCTNSVFGDPIYGTAKACWYRLSSTIDQGRLNMIRGLYRSILGRDADEGGLMSYYRSGLSQPQIRASMLGSSECARGESGGECRARRFDGALAQAAGDNASWLLSGNQRHRVKDIGAFWTIFYSNGGRHEKNWTHDQVYTIPEGAEASPPAYPPNDEGAIATDPNRHSFLLQGQQKHSIPDTDTYYDILRNNRNRAYDYSWERINRVATSSAVPTVRRPAQAPVIDSLGCPTSSTAGQTFTCTPTVRGTVTSRAWSASGGSPSTGNGVTFSLSFPSAGTRGVSLQACNGSACATRSQTVTISPAVKLTDAQLIAQAQEAARGKPQPLSYKECLEYVQARGLKVQAGGNTGAFNLLYESNDAKLFGPDGKPIDFSKIKGDWYAPSVAGHPTARMKTSVVSLGGVMDFTRVLKAGDVIVWNRGAAYASAAFGHIALVELVQSDRIVISEAHWSATGWRVLKTSDMVSGMYKYQ